MLTSRQGRSGQLPALAYYPEDNGDIEDNDALVPSRRGFNPGPTSTRLSLLESRLAQQELTTSTLLDRALRAKKDVIDSLEMNHGTWHEEKQARQLLQDHIRTITDVVKKLNHDIQVIHAMKNSQVHRECFKSIAIFVLHMYSRVFHGIMGKNIFLTTSSLTLYKVSF